MFTLNEDRPQHQASWIIFAFTYQFVVVSSFFLAIPIYVLKEFWSVFAKVLAWLPWVFLLIVLILGAGEMKMIWDKWVIVRRCWRKAELLEQEELLRRSTRVSEEF